MEKDNSTRVTKDKICQTLKYKVVKYQITVTVNMYIKTICDKLMSI